MREIAHIISPIKIKKKVVKITTTKNNKPILLEIIEKAEKKRKKSRKMAEKFLENLYK